MNGHEIDERRLAQHERCRVVGCTDEWYRIGAHVAENIVAALVTLCGEALARISCTTQIGETLVVYVGVSRDGDDIASVAIDLRRFVCGTQSTVGVHYECAIRGIDFAITVV